jgi:hypothetical protein
VISRQSSVTRRRALMGASSLAVLSVPIVSLSAPGAIPALFAQWEATWRPYIAALNEYGRAQEAWFPDKDNPEKAAAEQRAEAAKDAIEDKVHDLEWRIFEAPAVTLADVRCKLLVRSKTIGYGDGNIDDAGGHDHELLLRLLADVERLAGRAVAS